MKDIIKIYKDECAPRGIIEVAGDKSISHRAVMFGAISSGKTVAKNILLSEDTENTIAAFRALAIDIEQSGNEVIIHGGELKEPNKPLYMGNSGTTTRLIMGILSHLPFETTLTGDHSLTRRPMNRVAIPLRQMGANISATDDSETLPLTICGSNLKAIDYVSKTASAQVKSAILLAGLNADGVTSVTEPALSRDHTERMLQIFGAKISRNGLTVSIEGGQKLTGQEINVPGDISSAAFFMVLGCAHKCADIIIQNVGINPTRTGILDVLAQMGADVTLQNENMGFEPTADIRIKSSELRGTVIGGDIIPRLIDELPIIAVAALFADGKTVIKDAAELKVKESNRIESTARLITAFGGKVTTTDDGMIIEGREHLSPRDFTIDAEGDHRTAMSAAILAVLGNVECEIMGASSILTSFPTFTKILTDLGVNIES